MFLLLTPMAERAAPAAQGNAFQQDDLVSDIPGRARFTDPNLVNPWGFVFDEHGQLRVADNGTGLSTAYLANGTPLQLTIAIPGPGNQGQGTPTGVVKNHGDGFVISQGSKSAPARFIFATEDGTIAAFSRKVDPKQAVIAVDNSSSGAVYKGIALAQLGDRELLFATDFHNAKVDAFDESFGSAFSFSAPESSIPAGFAPFGIRTIGGRLYVTFAKQLPPENKDDEAGPGNGFVVIFKTDGSLERVFASRGSLNSPWGLAVSPDQFGVFSNSLLVGNFGDGHINAFDLGTGDFLGQLLDPNGNPIVIDGLWGLAFNCAPCDDKLEAEKKEECARSALLFFTAGLNDEADGLLGTLRVSSKAEHEDP